MNSCIRVVPRSELDTTAWNDCVQAAAQSVLYGYSWYLDAVLPPPDWQWIGLVLLSDQGAYQAVMPVPLRRKKVGVFYNKWVVHQPFFCQFLGVFSPDPFVDVPAFFGVLVEQFQYGSLYSFRVPAYTSHQTGYYQPQSTHLLDLSPGYHALYQHYAQDRKRNLRQANAFGWTYLDSTDVDPLLALFREHHASTVEQGVADWAYLIFRRLFNELSQRGLVTLRYAVRHHRIEAGALFVAEGTRLIYLFNAASPVGRRGHARTALLDQVINEKAGLPLWFDFESPAKASIRAFYRSFGAAEEPFWQMRWNRLGMVEKSLLAIKHGCLCRL